MLSDVIGNRQHWSETLHRAQFVIAWWGGFQRSSRRGSPFLINWSVIWNPVPLPCLSILSEAARGFSISETCAWVAWVMRSLWAHHHLHAGWAGWGMGQRHLGYQSHRADGPLCGEEEEGLLWAYWSFPPRAWSRECMVPPPYKQCFLPMRSTPPSAPLLGDHPHLWSTGGDIPITFRPVMMLEDPLWWRVTYSVSSLWVAFIPQSPICGGSGVKHGLNSEAK